MNNTRRRHPKGFMGLTVLISVVIVLILYMSIMRAFFPDSVPGSFVKQDRPWRLDDLILPPDKLVDMPKAPQLVIDDAFELKAAVSRKGSDRGFADLKFDENGIVSGKWECNYTHEEREYGYIAMFAGNIVTDKKAESTGESPSRHEISDESLLFFIVKGKYSQRVYHPDMGEKLTTGIIYLTGWVGPDKSLKGLLTITTNDLEDKNKWIVSYELTVPAKLKKN